MRNEILLQFKIPLHSLDKLDHEICDDKCLSLDDKKKT